MQSPHARKSSVTKKPLTSSVLFPELSKRFIENPSAVGSLTGLFIFSILVDGKIVDEWSLLFSGQNRPPSVSHQAVPALSKKAVSAPIVVLELEDRNLIKFITGSLTGIKGVTTGKIKVAGDIDLALKLERAFVKAGGIDQTLEFLRNKSRL
ncbi:hypothetical protein V1512DRAFT_265791 [Lipomyces arxii]|uniref:uncharacterized protein n=1 Tax=Lipomyces arxii TaxID=56418 RepID=UPI0034CF9136